jgi:hypothetical protein
MSTCSNPFGEPENGTALRQRELEQAIICPECNSTWFAELTYNQYSDMTYGAGAGSDLRVISIMPQTIRVCLCGHPFTPNISGIRGRVATAEMDSFKISLANAHIARKNRNQVPESVSMDTVARNFATLTDTDLLKQQLGSIQEKLNAQGREVENLKLRNAQLEEAAKTPVAEAVTTTAEPEIELAPEPKLEAAVEVAEVTKEESGTPELTPLRSHAIAKRNDGRRVTPQNSKTRPATKRRVGK